MDVLSYALAMVTPSGNTTSDVGFGPRSLGFTLAMYEYAGTTVIYAPSATSSRNVSGNMRPRQMSIPTRTVSPPPSKGTSSALLGVRHLVVKKPSLDAP